MPTYDVKILFRGLCPFVPGADLDNGGKPDWVGAFLVNASRQKLKQVDAADLPVHLPYLRFKASDLLGNEGGPDEMVLLKLDFVDVVFVPSAGTQQQLVVNFAEPATLGEVPLDDAQDRLFNWVTKMSDVMPGSGKVHRDCFEVHPRTGRIVARVHIDHGKLETDRLGRIQDHLILSRLAAVSRQQATGRSVLLTMPCETGNPFRIKISPFLAPANPAAPEPVREIVFRDPGAGGSLQLEIVNLCVDDLLDQGDVTLEGLFRPDSDFRLCYMLSSGVRSLAGLPVPMPVAPSAEDLKEIKKAIKKLGGGGPEGVQCKPPRAEAATDAALTAMQQTVIRVRQG